MSFQIFALPDPTVPVAPADKRRKGRGPGIRCAVLLIVLMSLLAPGCGNITAGGFGEVSVSVVGDDPETGGAVTLDLDAPGSLSRVSIGLSHDDEPEGKLEIEFLASLVNSRGDVVPIDDKEIEVELDLVGFFEADAVVARLPADHYIALRIEFTEIEVEVDRGVVIDGIEIQGPIEIELEDDESIIIERSLDARLLDGGRIDVLLDMNARTWLAAIDPDLRTVAERVFSQAIAIRVR